MLIDHLFLVVFGSFVVGALVLSATLLFGDGLRKFSRKGRGGFDRALRFGGVIVGVIFLLVIIGDSRLEFTNEFFWLTLSAIALMGVGLFDDIRSLSWKFQLIAQTGIVSMAIFGAGIRMTEVPHFLGGRLVLDGEWAWLAIIVAIAWFLLIINAINWIDGIDGLASGIIVIAGVSLAILSLRPEVFQPPLAIAGLALSGVFFALWLFNLFPAKIFMGTAGVYVAGFIIAYLSLVSGAKTATVALILAIPILDAIRVVTQRYFLGKSLVIPDRSHIHYELSQYGLSPQLVSFILLGITIFFATFAIFLGPIGKIVFFAIAGIVIFSLFLRTKRG